ncbi:MAG: hypothetical protein WCT99_06795 [Bacteroidota bacterium]|jgi:hypothetical protein
MRSVTWAILLLALGVMSCKNSTEPDEKTLTPVKDTLAFTYDSVATFTTSQSIMLCGNSQNIFIYGAYGNLSIYNIASRTVTDHSTLSDTLSWRWDGAFVSVDTSMYIFALPAPNRPAYSKVLLFNQQTYRVTATAAPFPFSLGLDPAYGVFGKKIALLYSSYDSLYVFDTSTMTGGFVAQNKLKYPGNAYSSCVYQNGLYIFVDYYMKFYRVDLQNYSWQEIVIPDSIQSNIDTYAQGGMLGNKFCLFNNPDRPGTTVAFDLTTQKWQVGAPNKKMKLGVWYSNNTSLYVSTEDYTTLWKVSLSQ